MFENKKILVSIIHFFHTVIDLWISEFCCFIYSILNEIVIILFRNEKNWAQKKINFMKNIKMKYKRISMLKIKFKGGVNNYSWHGWRSSWFEQFLTQPPHNALLPHGPQFWVLDPSPDPQKWPIWDDCGKPLW